MLQKRNKVIIVGGGMAGKLLAAATAPYFTSVVILEKDKKPENTRGVRAGVSQGHHIHALLHAGDHAMEKLFPGFKTDMEARGSIPIDSLKDLAWYHHGVWKIRVPSQDTTLLQTRPLLESYVEERIEQISNISYTYGVKVLAYKLDASGKVCGVEIQTEHAVKTLDGDLVIDTSGSGSISKTWLKKQGITVPEEKVEIGLCYATRQFTLPNEPRDFKIKIIYPEPPDQSMGGTLSMVEDGKYIVTLFGYLDSLKPSEVKSSAGFIECTGKLPLPDIHQELVNGVPVSETSIFQVPFISWRRFDKVALPEGLLVAGDSVCRIDPVFGQGMSIAALEAMAIRDYFASTSASSNLKKLQKKLARIVAPVWSMVLCEDFRYPSVKGKKPLGLRFQQWYVKNLFLLSANNELIYKDIIKVINLVSPATILFKPRTIKAVFKRE